MAFRVDFSPEVEADLSRLDKQAAQRVLTRIKWLGQNAESVTHKALTGGLRGAFRLRVGDYRVLYDLDRKSAVITVQYIAHRSEVYRSK